MKIVINALSARRGGAQTYIINLLENLDSCNEMRIFVLAPDSLLLPPNPKVRRIHANWPTDNPLFRFLWERCLLPGVLKKVGADVLFCPGGLINAVPPDGCRTVTMFRNMIPFDPVQRARYPLGLERMRNLILKRALLRSMIKADLVIFVSNFARKVIEAKARGRIGKSVTIHHGLSKAFKTAEKSIKRRPKWVPENEYLLYVSTFDVYRNQLQVVQGFGLLKKRLDMPLKLVLVGHNRSNYGKIVMDEICRLQLESDVFLPGHISYNDLPNAYHHAKLIIFASECENCPNILLESLAAGRPVVVSNRQPMPEFAGKAVVYFNPASPEELAEKVASILEDPSYIAELSAKAEVQARQYNWRETVNQTCKAIEDLCRN